MPPALSIVIPTRDTRELTLACLGSLVREAGVPGGLEILVADDGSSDGTAEAIAGRHPEVTVVRSASPVGFSRVVNLGLAGARGDVLLLLNSDTEVEPGGLAALLAALANDSRLGAVGATLHYPDGTPQWSGGRAPTLAWLFGLASGLPAQLGRLPLYRRLKPAGGGRQRRDTASQPVPVDWVTGAALALRRAAWEESGPLDEGYRFYAQDLDLCLRLGEAGWTVAVLPGFRVLHHHGATIGGSDGSAGGRRSDLATAGLLWGDLLRWAEQRRPAPWARRAFWALRAGTRLRLWARRLALPVVPAAKRRAWDEGTRQLAAARQDLRPAGPPV